jgi:nitroreductase
VEFADILRRRKMVRNYTDQPVPREVVKRIVERGRKAPRGGFSQGVRMVVVTDGETRGRIAVVAQEPKYVAMGLEPWISRAPVHVVVATREDDYHDRYRQPDKLDKSGEEIDIGHAAPETQRGSRRLGWKPLEEVVRWEHW